MPSPPGRLLRVLFSAVPAVALACGLLVAALTARPAAAQTGAPGVPALASPAEGSTGNSLTPALSWQQPSGAVAGSTVYTVLLVDAVTGQWLATQTTTALAYAVAGTEGLQNGREYYWTVQACNGANCSGYARAWGSWTQTPPGSPDFPPFVAPVSGATATGATPTLSWSAPSGSTAGSTSYTVSLEDAVSGAALASLQPTTNTSIAVPPGENLALGHTYNWNVNACNGATCSGLGPWTWFSTSSAPGTGLQSAPGNGATNVDPFAFDLLTWNPPAGAVYGSTTYTVSIWDPYGETNGHLLGDIAANNSGTGLNATILPGEGLNYGQTYYWNVSACNGLVCSGYNNTWFSFTTEPQPAATASGAIVQTVDDPDFGGLAIPQINVFPPGWTQAQPNGGSWTFTQTLPMTLPFNSTCTQVYNAFGPWWQPGGSGGVNCSLFRLGYQFPSSGGGPQLNVAWLANGTWTYLYADFSSLYGTFGNWLEGDFGVPASAGSPGQLVITLETTSTWPEVAFLDRTDVPSSAAIPQLGLSAEPRFPKVTSPYAGAGVDLITGAFADAATDLSLPGLSGPLNFSRAYNSRQLITPANLSLLPAPLGNRWTDNWEASLTFPTSSTAVIRTPGGGIYSFTYDPTYARYTPPPGVSASFSGTTLTTANQTQYVFSNNFGSWPTYLLTAVKDRTGNSTTLAYTGTQLSSVTDANGRALTFSYQAGTGLLASVTDNAGRSVQYGYTGNDLTSVTNIWGGVTHYAYTGVLNADWLSQITDPLGHVVLTNMYDSSTGRISSQQDAGDGSTRGTITYHYQTPSAGITQVVDQRGKTLSYYFDTTLRPTDIISPSGVRLSWSYDTDNNVTREENTQEIIGGFTYDSKGNRLSAIDALDYMTTYTYDSLNDVLTVTDPRHGVTTNTYDAHGNLATTKNAGGYSTSYTRNALGQVTAVQSGRGYTTSYGYTNSYHDRTTVTDPLNNTTTTVYDAAGRVASVTDPLSHATTFSYTITSGTGETDTAIDALGDTTTTTLNLAGQTASVQDPNGHTTSYAYDPRGLLKTVTDALGHQTVYGYDAGGNRSSVQDANGYTTSYTFNDDGHALTISDPLARTLLTFTYDNLGRTTTRRDNRGITTTYGYDARNLLTSASYSGGASNVSYVYDALGNRTSMTDGTGTTSYQYDALSRLTSVTFPGSHTVQYAYDADSNRTTLYYSGSQRPVSYSYDPLDRLSTVTDWNNAQTVYYYDNAGRLVTEALPSGTGIDHYFAYDNANRLTNVSYVQGSTTLVWGGYTLDADGNRTSKTFTGPYLPGGGGTEYYCLDALNRLTSVRTAAGCTGGSQTEGYAYDNVGNRTSLTTAAGTTGYSYDHADQLTAVTPPGSGASTYSYDGNGNQTARGSDTFTWDAENRLTAATVGGQAESNTYNGDGLRQNRTAAGTTKSFVWDVAGKLPLLLDDGSQYIYGLGLISRVVGNQTYYDLSDGLGSVLAIVDSGGSVQQRYAYDAFGAVTQQSGSLGSEQQFAGQQTDPDGLQYLRARYYDPGTGRFLSRDAWANDDKTVFHPYVYARNNPATAIDPGGHDCSEETLADCEGINPANSGGPETDETFVGENRFSQNPTPAQIDAANAAAQAATDSANAAADHAEGANAQAAASEAVEDNNLASPARTQHILQGDATGGGHQWPGEPGKSPFPPSWSGTQIMNAISDIATDPAAWQNAIIQGSRAVLTGTVDGVDIRVVLDTQTGEIITGYPTNLPRNP